MQEKPTILIVDDTVDFIESLKNILDGSYNVISTDNGIMALQLARSNNQPDLILLDVMMPEMDGYEVCRCLKENNTTRNIPVIFVTSKSDIDDERKGLKLGAVDYITKPFSPPIVLARVKTQLALYHKSLLLEEDLQVGTSQLVETNRLLKNEMMIKENILSSIVSIMIGISKENKIFLWNDTAEKVLKISAADAIQSRLESLSIPWEWDTLCEGIASCIIEDEPVQVYSMKLHMNKLEPVFLNLIINPVKDRENNLDGFMIYGDDITERKIMEQQFFQAQKLESIGQLASGITHEIKTPVNYIHENLNFMNESYKQIEPLLKLLKNTDVQTGKISHEAMENFRSHSHDIDIGFILDEMPKALEDSLEGIERISLIVKSMKQYFHPGEEVKTRINVNNIIEDIINISRNEWKYVAEVETNLDSAMPEIDCFPSELNQVFLNIVVNAAHAVSMAKDEQEDKKGKIIISTRTVENYVEVLIQDNGPGIPENIQSKIFDPFFTTKKIGEGTGQGLAIAHSIVVKHHNGSIFCKSEEGIGTTFIISIPKKHSATCC